VARASLAGGLPSTGKARGATIRSVFGVADGEGVAEATLPNGVAGFAGVMRWMLSKSFTMYKPSTSTPTAMIKGRSAGRLAGDRRTIGGGALLGASCSCRLARMWEALALTAALCQVLRNTVMKRLGHELDEYMAVWGRFTFLLPFAALFVLWHGMPAIKPGFVWACLLFAVCQIISTMALSKALKLSPISMVTALWKVSLLILVGLGYVTLKETPSLLGIAGILISMSGVYLLNVQRAHISWWAPLTVLFTDRGLRYTLLAALFFAPSVITIKWAMQLSDPYMGTLGGYLAASLLVTPIVLITSRKYFAAVPRHWMAFVSFGLFAALTTVTQGHAYLLTLSSYVEAVKQVEILFALAIGALLFGEKQKVREIAPGAFVMLAGVVLLSLAG